MTRLPSTSACMWLQTDEAHPQGLKLEEAPRAAEQL